MSGLFLNPAGPTGALLSERSRHLRQMQGESRGEGYSPIVVMRSLMSEVLDCNSNWCQVCPTCRVTMTHCVSQVAATIIQKIQHPCDFREAGCDQRCDINNISAHEESCRFRLVRCPHWACDEQISVTNLTSHVLSAECGDNYMSNPLPYQEEIEYTR